MHLGRYLKPEFIKLALPRELGAQPGEGDDPERFRWRIKEGVMAEISALLCATGKIRNETRFFKDFVAREKKVSTAVGDGIALPHVRSMQPRELVICFARSREGVEYMAFDGGLTHLFFALASPPYDDSAYLRIYSEIARAFVDEKWLKGALLEAADEHEVIAILRSLR
jgi:mannitol/fructose-specific phosphotransferase system IIA component (Ntr-type)